MIVQEKIKQLSQPLSSNVDHLEILHDISTIYYEGRIPQSKLMKFFMNGLELIPTKKEKEIWNENIYYSLRKKFEARYFELLEILQTENNSFKYNFEICSSSELTPGKFMNYPIWSEYYDDGELYDLRKWGINKKLAIKELISKEEDQDHPYYTVPIYEFPIKRMRYFNKTVFKSLDNKLLHGYIVNKAENCISIFTGQTEEIISNHFFNSSEHQLSMQNISKYYNIKQSDMRELTFETVIPANKSRRISGVFKLL